MNVFYSILYMYLLTAVISFFVAFVMSALYKLIKLTETKKKEVIEEPVTVMNIKEVQIEAQREEIVAAISIALDLFTKEQHDNETLKLTINKALKPYSPWNSKIYGLNNFRR